MKSPNLLEAIQSELVRAKEILKMYEEIPQGAFGAAMIREEIRAAEIALLNMDVVQMLICYKQLKEIQ